MIETTGVPHLRQGAFEFVHLVLAETKTFEEHRHDLGHMVLLYRGAWTDVSSAGTIHLRPGELLFHPERFVHASRAAARNTEVVIIHVDHEMTRAFCPLYGNAARDVRLPFAAVRGTPERIREELLRRDEAAAPIIIESLMMQLCALGSRTSASSLSVPPSWLASVLTFIRQELASPLTVEMIAAHVGVSASRLAHVFRDVLGRTVAEYIRERRVRAAAAALRETNDPVGDVALACGFYDQAHLTRAFKASRNMTPLEYRRSYRARMNAGKASSADPYKFDTDHQAL